LPLGVRTPIDRPPPFAGPGGDGGFSLANLFFAGAVSLFCVAFDDEALKLF